MTCNAKVHKLFYFREMGIKQIYSVRILLLVQFNQGISLTHTPPPPLPRTLLPSAVRRKNVHEIF